MDHTKRFMELLEITDKKMKIIHVAGTNGKGSTCAYMNEILCGDGYQVGLFTSPHLENMTERIRINGVEITKEEFVEVFCEVIKVTNIMEEENLSHPTFFEFLLGMAMRAFAKSEMEYVILETGLGGRLDATNVFANPVATVITSIGLDHQQYLGETIQEIAWEKAGIIKENTPVIYGGKQEIVHSVIEEHAHRLGSICKKIADSAYEITEKNEKYIAFYLKDEYDKHVTWKIKNRGTYQVENAVLALGTLMTVIPERNQNYKRWQKSLFQTTWSGRMEEIQEGIYVDGAHNTAAIEAVTRDCREWDVILFSAVSDKNYDQMIEVLAEQIKVNAYIVTTIEDSRGVPAKELGELIRQKVQVPVYVEETIDDAWKLLQEIKPQGGRALCIGSLYLVGMLKKISK